MWQGRKTARFLGSRVGAGIQAKGCTQSFAGEDIFAQLFWYQLSWSSAFPIPRSLAGNMGM